MNIKERGKNFEIYEDGSVKIACSRCKKEDWLKSDHRLAIQLNQIDAPHKGDDYLCLGCWRAEREEKREELYNRKLDEIIIGQAANLAVQTILDLHGEELKRDGKKIKELLMSYFRSYRNFLKEAYEVADKNGKSS